MKHILLLLALIAATASAQTPVCKIYGRVDSVAGPTSSLTAAKGSITITRAAKNNTLFLNTSRVVNILPDGTFNFYAPRTTGTDTALIHVKANFGDLAAGQILYVPDADSAELRTMVRYTANPQMVVVAVPAVTDDSTQSIFDPAGTQKIPAARLDVGAVTGDTTGTTNQPMQSRLEDDVKAAKDTASAANKAANTADGKATDAGNVAHVALNVASGARDSTSINGVKRRTFTLTAIGRLTITQTNDSTFEWSLDTTSLMQGPRITALEGSVAAAQDSARKSNDSVRVISPLATTTKNDLTAHISTADAHLPVQTGSSGKFLQSNGTASSWQTAITAESDPTVAARIKDSLALYNLGIMRGDSAALTKVLDMIYPRSGVGGAPADTMRTLPVGGAPKTASGYLTWAGKTRYSALNVPGLSADSVRTTLVIGGVAGVAIGNVGSTTAPGFAAVAMGRQATASGTQSFAAGYEVVASGTGSVAIGQGLLANDVAETVVGIYNDSTGNNAFAVGIGTVGVRLNALAIDRTTGSARFVSTVSAKTLVVDSVIVNRNLVGTAYLRGEVTIGAGDSVTVTVLGVTETDYIALGYHMGKTAIGAETGLSWSVWAANTLTIYGVQNRKVNYIRMM